jgi:hypothetical protein
VSFDPIASRLRIAWISFFAGGLGLLVIIFRGNYSEGLPLGIVQASTSIAGVCLAGASLLGLIVFARSEFRAIHGIRMSRLTGDLLNAALADSSLGQSSRSRFSLEAPWFFLLSPIYLLAFISIVLPKLNTGAAIVYYCLPAPVIVILLGVHQSRSSDRAAAPTLWLISALALAWSIRILFLLMRA